MADFSDAKNSLGSVYPENTIESPWNFLEPLITARQLRRRHLRGLPLMAGISDPLTGMPDLVTDEDLKDDILRAVAIAETETHIDIMPRVRKEKHAFDINEWQSYGYFVLDHRPCSSVIKMSITPSSEVDIFIVPNQWIDTGHLIHGQINIIPLVPATGIQGSLPGGGIYSGASGGSVFLNQVAMARWIPAYWEIEYASGFPDGLLPRIMNDLIGTIAAQETLSMLAATYANSMSSSLSIDSISQSVSGPGATLYKNRYNELQEKREKITRKIKSLYKMKIFSGNV